MAAQFGFVTGNTVRPAPAAAFLGKRETEPFDRGFVPLEAPPRIALQEGPHRLRIAGDSPSRNRPDYRHAALESCQFLIDWLKTKAPFWKLEEPDDGDGRWVDARVSDDEAAARWQQNDKPKAAE